MVFFLKNHFLFHCINSVERIGGGGGGGTSFGYEDRMGKGTRGGWGCCLFRCLQISHFEVPMGIVPSAYTMSFPYRKRPAVWQGLHSMLIQRAHCPLPEHPCGALAVHPQPLGLETNHQPPVWQGLHSMLIQRARCPLPEHPCGALAVHPQPLRLEARHRHVFLDYLLTEVFPSHTLEVIPAAFAQATNTVVHLPLPHTTCPALPCLSGCPVSSLSTAVSSVYLR